MSTINNIGLNSGQSEELAGKLNDLLANYSVFYQNTRGFHWKISGRAFFELHQKFEELYNDLLVKIDEIAERILTLGNEPKHQFTSYLEVSKVKESADISDGTEAVTHILEAFKVLLIKQREILDLADAMGDEGSSALMSDYIREQEKLVWMYSAYLK